MDKEVSWLLQEKYHGKPTTQFKRDIKRIEAGEPLDYIIGFAEFLDCRIDLSKKPLIPRIETEYWADKAIEDMKLHKGVATVLDMFSGSGCIGVAVLKHVSSANVIFAEKDENCPPQIKINCVINHIDKKRYMVIESDVFEKVEGTFDYILANPPYIPKKNTHKIQPSALTYEPHMALFGGEDGLLYVGKFLASAKDFLNPAGKIYMEFDSPQKKGIDSLCKKYGYKTWEFHKDQYQRWRYLVAENG